MSYRHGFFLSVFDIMAVTDVVAVTIILTVSDIIAVTDIMAVTDIIPVTDIMAITDVVAVTDILTVSDIIAVTVILSINEMCVRSMRAYVSICLKMTMAIVSQKYVTEARLPLQKKFAWKTKNTTADSYTEISATTVPTTSAEISPAENAALQITLQKMRQEKSQENNSCSKYNKKRTAPGRNGTRVAQVKGKSFSH